MASLKYENKRSPKSGAEGSAEEERTESPAEAKAEGDAPDAEMDQRKAMFKRHETERRDMHGSHRDMHRQMTDRHEKEIAELFKGKSGTAEKA